MITTIVADHYRILTLLARGGMGTLHRAEQLSTGRIRALKLLHPEFSADPGFRAHFEFEARCGARIPSPHVVEVIDAGLDEPIDTLWLAMELLQGRPLQEALEGRLPLPASAAWSLLAQLGHALSAAHAQGILHLDLKPENLFLTDPDGPGLPPMLKVLDFGIGRALREGRTAATVTRACGSPLWMAPEQSEQGRQVRPSTDVWALGLLAFWMLTGRRYWREGNVPRPKVQRIFAEVLHGPLDSPAARVQEFGLALTLPTGFDAWFLACVAREPERRFPHAAAAFGALERVLAPSHDVSTTMALGGAPMPPREFREAAGAAAMLPSDDATVVADAATLDAQERSSSPTPDERADEAAQWSQRAELSMKLRKWAEAVGDFSEAIVRAPGVAAYWYGRAQAFGALGQDALMRVDLTQAALLGHEGALAWRRRGESL